MLGGSLLGESKANFILDAVLETEKSRGMKAMWIHAGKV
jgi:hypothetical protein